MDKTSPLKKLSELYNRAKEQGVILNKDVFNNLRIMRSFIHDPKIVYKYAQKTEALLDYLSIVNPPDRILFKQPAWDRRYRNGICHLP